ncbi:MAG: hypothetical protein QOE89_4087 [Pseudonocardiales bacterium]|jgi:hypothetical protein|nr:hypothetical protein [Pseudonocardiales bacterium]
MQGWIVAGAWVFAVLFALVLLAFIGYELSWKGRRLQKDKARLEELVGQLASVAAELQSTTERARHVQAGPAAESAEPSSSAATG